MIDITDITFRLIRKYIPAVLYKLLQKTIGRYNQYDNTERYFMIVNEYVQNIDIKNKVVLEIGPGNQLYTAMLLVACGAKKVILIDDALDIELLREVKFPKQYKQIVDSKNGISEKFETISLERVKSKIVLHDSDIYSDAILKKYNSEIDVILSYHVLEHIFDISNLFHRFKLLLKPNGSMFHQIDISDHIYHIFHYKYNTSKTFYEKTAQKYLRYSDKVFRILNDSKCSMNRLLIPDYLYILNENNNFKLGSIKPKVKINKPDSHISIDILNKFNDNNVVFLSFTDFSITCISC